MGLKESLNTDKFRELLKARGYRSIAQFAKASGIHRSTINDYVYRGRPVFSKGFLEICNGLKVSPEDLRFATAETAEGDDRVRKAGEILKRIADSRPNLAFLLIGSRAKGSFREYSDIDIGVTKGMGRIDSREYLRLKAVFDDEFEDFGVDVHLVNLDQAPGWFLRDITYEPVLLAGSEGSFYFMRGAIHGIQRSEKTA